LQAGDRIVEIAGKPITDINNYTTVLAAQNSGQPLEVVVIRDTKRRTFKVLLE
jgi:S1-C subfamily serine protease